MYKYKQNNDLAFATSILRTVTVKKWQYIKVKEVRRLMTDVRRWEEERRHMKTKRDNAKVTQKP